jgi:hypothetical protein
MIFDMPNMKLSLRKLIKRWLKFHRHKDWVKLQRGI